MNRLVSRSRSRGLSLIELMISLVIGLVVVGAVIVSIVGSNSAGKYQAVFAQMNEDAQIALSMMSRDLQMAGYAMPTALTISGGALATSVLSSTNLGTSTFVFGCDTGFSNPRATTLACGTATTPAFEVVYEADVRNTVPVGAGATPSDCLGNSIAGASPFVARNRYFIAPGPAGRPELYCTSVNAAAAPGQLVENVESMTVRYGTAVLASPTQVVRYVGATNIATLAGTATAEWNRVLSVRLCLLVRSADPVLSTGEDTLTYLDCNGAQQTSNDRFLRRAYFTTATLRGVMP